MNTYSIHPQLEGASVDYDPSIVLPPDTATVAMAASAGYVLKWAKLAQQLHEGEIGTDQPVSVADLGAGSGIIGCVLLEINPNITDILAIDNDAATIPIAWNNLERANHRRLARGLGKAALTVGEADWNDGKIWQLVGPRDLIISNPPYLVDGEVVREGYEQVPHDHLYVDSETMLVETYTHLLMRSLQLMRTWDALCLRLPRALEGEDTWRWLMQSLNAAKPEVDGWYSLHSTKKLSLYDRPSHFVIIESLPLDYTPMSVIGDARVDYYLRNGRDPGVLNIGPRGGREPGEVIFVSDHHF